MEISDSREKNGFETTTNAFFRVEASSSFCVAPFSPSKRKKIQFSCNILGIVVRLIPVFKCAKDKANIRKHHADKEFYGHVIMEVGKTNQ